MVLFSSPYVQGTRWRSWLRYCATSRKVAGSIHWNFSFSMALDSSLPLSEMSTWAISWGGNGGRCLQLTNLSPSCAYFLEIQAASISCPKGLSRPAQGYTLHVLYPAKSPECVCRRWSMKFCILLYICLSGMHSDNFAFLTAVRSEANTLSLQLEHGIPKYVDGKVVMKPN